MSEKLPSKTIHQEQLFVSNSEMEIVTILGSCVAVCLWDPIAKVAGMNHYLLPLWNGDGLKTLKYGNIATSRLIDEMIKQGCRKHNIVAKIFGGAAINMHEVFGVGKKNIIVAEDILADNNIKIVAKDVGGARGRKVILSSIDGGVYVKYSS